MGTLSAKAEQLLEAQVAFLVDQITADNLQPLVERNVRQALEDAKQIKLGDVITSESIKKTAIKYASDMEIGPGVPELVGDIAREIYHNKIFDEHTPGDLMTQKEYKEFLVKVAEMEDARKQLISEVVSNPFYASLMSDLLYHGIQDYITTNPLAKKIPGAQSMMKFGKSMMDKATPNLEAALKKYVASNISVTLRESERFLNKNLTNEKIIELGLDAWVDFKDLKISGFRRYITTNDIEEAYVAGFEYWKHLRTTDFYKACISAVIDFFYDKYKYISLYDLLQDLYIKEEMLVDDAMTFAPMVIEYLKQRGMLQDALRRNLQPFFESDAAAAILGE
ncbi:MAG: hypothetical protein R3208_22000 [Ketobacteraceae bacterium]|nr:hypothetical protein [Ketobacteraceae bacterium]